MPKILLITTYFPPTIGGAEDYLYNIYKRLPNDKVVVLTNKAKDDPRPQFDSKQPFKIIREKFFKERGWPSWRHLKKKVKRIIKEQGIEEIHFGHYAHFILIARILKLPYFIYTHGSDIPSYTKSWLGKKITISNLKKAKKIIATSHYLKSQVTALGIPGNKIEVVHPALDLEQYDIPPESWRPLRRPLRPSKCEVRIETRALARLQSANKKIILSVGHLTPVKGFDIAIKTLPQILKQIPNALYLIIGDGKEKQNLKNLTRQLNLEKNIIFTGEIKDKKELSKYYAQADLYLGPSRHEGFGIVFLEARAFGLPIVAFNVGGIKEAAGDKAILVEPGNIHTLAQKVINILKSNKKYEPEKNLDWKNITMILPSIKVI